MSTTINKDAASDLESREYLEKRTLRRGTAGWVLLAGLGVSYVISGDYAGWNSGLGTGGFGGLLIAFVIVAGMYLAMVLGMAEPAPRCLPRVADTPSPARRSGLGEGSSPARRS